MALEYSITYKAENNYEHWVEEAHWQFLIIPEDNSTQRLTDLHFENSLEAWYGSSMNGYGFRTVRVHAKKKFKSISFEAVFKVLKEEVNPFELLSSAPAENAYRKIEESVFKVDFEPFLRKTDLTRMPDSAMDLFVFDQGKSPFENLQQLNHFTYQHIYFETGVTDVHTTLAEVIEKRKGVCQDFAHLFCALARRNGFPARYVSGYLHQGNGYFGDSQMHAWAEVFLPEIGWMGFDPTNDLLTNTDHIKVAHGKDYTDCSPLKGVVFSQGSNETKHSVSVSGQQQQ